MKDEFVWIAVIMLLAIIGIFYTIKGGKPTVPTTTLKTTISTENSNNSNTSTSATESSYKSNVSMYINGAGSSDFNQEYVSLSTYGDTPINITGWTLKSTLTSNRATIPQGVELYKENSQNTNGAIILKPGEQAILATGLSPIIYSFKINKCSGYLSENHYFSQYISQNCPMPEENDIPISNLNDRDKCYDYFRYLPTCKTQSDNSFPKPDSYNPVGGICKNFIQQKLNYNACLADYKNDKDFYKNEWRVYLGAHSALWRANHDTVELRDSSGKLVATQSW